MRMQLRPIAVGIVSLGLAAALTACGEAGGGGNGDGDGNGSGEGKESGTIGLLLPENSTTRYESFDRPSIEGKIAELCSDCKVQYNNANEDTALQKQQFDAMLTQGVDVIILDAVDSASTSSWVEEAAAQGVPVVAYDRLAEGDVVAYVSYDNTEVGRLQGQALLEALGDDAEGAGVVMINGSPTDPNAAMFKAGAHEVLDGVVDIVYESDVDGWDAALANEDVTGAVESLGGDAIDAVYSANDGMAAGIITALHAANLHDTVVGGQDAELAGLQRIISGEQTFTIYKALVPQGELTAEIAVRVLRGEDFSDLTTGTVDSPTTQGVPSALLTPVTVTVDNINETVIADEFYTAEAICTRDYADACAEAGIGG
ncbi:substrate-binding domain-containing protein [Streptomyces carpaticus]|uniref:D-xylose transport system substrate-binding protein n=1 Tax=Streptomyces harbinensis TaxID=1176198 RepID=A0A1I6PTP0_9ACTN|nr:MULTISPECIES: substrate-binding domain-containing protein [Streptomyces]UWM51802.1 substrate-binding domain-containing protein [Streptomyces carpaticus]SFS43574.1 D-xylose transport system substrate-binding protein [Streptomyces harbinensis]